MKRFYYLFYLLPLLTACRSNNVNKPGYVQARSLLVDSFMITGLESGYGVSYLRFTDSNTLFSYDMSVKKGRIYLVSFGSTNKSDDSVEVTAAPGHTPLFSSFFLSGKNTYCKYEEVPKAWGEFTFGGQLIFSQKIGYTPGYQFFLEPGDDGLGYLSHDTLTTNLLYSKYEDMAKYYDGNQLVRWVCNSRGFALLDTFAKAPANWRTHQESGYLFSLYGSQTLYVFPDYDSLYIRNSETKTTHARYIGNKDYTRPAPYINKVGSPDYNQYRTTYDLSNFLYKAIIHNPVTGHYILFYVKPLKWTNKEVAATYEDQPMYALVLSSDLKPIRYVEFSGKYFHPGVFFNVPGKGIALPIYKMKISYEDTVQIDIFNL